MDVDVLPVPTDLGLRPSGVSGGAETLLGLGLADRLSAAVLPAMVVPGFDPAPDPVWGVPNIDPAAALAREQADVLAAVLAGERFPVVLGGDDSVLFGCLLALRRSGETGLMFLDGHTDFWDPRDGDGELSDSDLWIVTGHGPEPLATLAGETPLVGAERCVVYGHRDRADSVAQNSQDVYEYPMLVRGLAELRAVGAPTAGAHARAWLRSLGRGRVWLHLDADCLDDAVMPAVDWRVPGGLSASEIPELIEPLAAAGLLAGMDVTIYNPALDDHDHGAGRALTDLVVEIVRLVDGG
jgi:arginase